MFLWEVIQLTGLVLIFTIVLTGWGQIGLWVLRIKAPRGFDIYPTWIGFGFLIGFLEILHLFFAIDWKISLLVSSIGILGITVFFSFKSFIKNLFLFFKKTKKFTRIFILIGTLFFVILALRSMGTVNNYDSGIYHFSSIRWANEYPIIPGLGNLFSALAYNQSYFLFLGLLNIYPFWNHGYAMGGLVLLFITSLTVAQFCIRSSPPLRWTFGIPICIFLGYLGGTLSNPSPDTAVSLLQIIIILLLVTLSHPKTALNERRQLLLSTLIVLTITIVTIKVSSAMFALLTFLLTLISAKKSFYRNGKWKLLLFVSLIVGSTHLIRGYLLSGTPLYPSEIGLLLNLPWAMSPDSISGERLWIYVWSRMPGAKPSEVLGSWAWLPYWMSELSFGVLVFFSTLLLLFLINLYLFFSKNASSILRYNFLLLNFLIISSVVFWFISAPQIRFLGALPFLFLSLNLWFLIEIGLLKAIIFNKIFYTKNRIFLNLIVIIITSLITLKLIGIRSISLHGWSHLPYVTTQYKTTVPGLKINTPAEGNQCWNSTLPCSPQVKDELDSMSWPTGIFIFNFLQERPIYRLRY